MIENILILLIANIAIPMLPIPPQTIAPIAIAHTFYYRQHSVYQHMNLSRIHTRQQFKRAFKQSLKRLHPDRGGDAHAFNQVQNLKKIMQKQTNYHDTLNITSSDLEHSANIQDAVTVKQTSYYVETGIYYFILMLYTLAFTIDQNLKPARKYLLPLIILFGGYQLFIHFNPQIITVIDLFHNKIPIFMQKAMMKRLLVIFVAIIRTRFSRNLTDQKRLLNKLDQNQSEANYKQILLELLNVYKIRADKKVKKQKSWGTKIRKLISGLFTVFVLYSIATGFFAGGGSQKDGDL